MVQPLTRAGVFYSGFSQISFAFAFSSSATHRALCRIQQWIFHRRFTCYGGGFRVTTDVGLGSW